MHAFAAVQSARTSNAETSAPCGRRTRDLRRDQRPRPSRQEHLDFVGETPTPLLASAPARCHGLDRAQVRASLSCVNHFVILRMKRNVLGAAPAANFKG